MFLSNQLSNNILVQPVLTKKQLITFINLPKILYQHCKEYTPPLDFQNTELLHPKKSPFFKYGNVKYFLAYQNHQVVGRISAQIDPLALKEWKESIGFFGALDAIDNLEVIKALINAATQWLKQFGIEKIRGPYNLNTNSEIGIMIEGQTSKAMTAMPWHPKWLYKHLEEAGLIKAMDLVSYQMQISEKTRALHKVPSSLRQGHASLKNITIRKLEKKHIARDGEILRKLYNEAWKDNWGFVSLTHIEMNYLIKQLKLLLKPENFVLIEHNHIPVAVALIIPNIYDVMHDTGPSPSLLGWLKIFHRSIQHQFKSARVILLGISHVIRNTALGAIMPSLVISELFERGKNLPYEMIELGWVLETNTAIRNLIERIVPEPCKIHRLYEKKIN